MRKSILEVLMERDGLSRDDAMCLIQEARKDLMDIIEDGEDAYNFCQERFGLEPDYLDDLI